MSRSTRQTAWLVVGLALTIGPLPVAADDAHLGSIGGRLAPLNSEHIRMVSETINVRLRDGTALVNCEFVFENEGPAHKVKAGFPQPWDEAPLNDFRCWVDGIEIEVESELTRVTGEAWQDVPESERPHEGWYWWWLSFEPEQTHRITHTYVADYTGHSSGAQSFMYTLTTGRTWKGTIGEATIEVDLGPVENAAIWHIRPAGYEADGSLVTPTEHYYQPDFRRVTWHWEDFEPREDIDITWRYTPQVVLDAPFAAKLSHEPRLRMPVADAKRGGAIFAPLRWMADLVGAECRWDGGTETVALVPRSGRGLAFTVGSSVAQYDWGPMPLGGTVRKLNGQVLVPIRPAAEWLGLSVDFRVVGWLGGDDLYYRTFAPGYYWIRLSRTS